MKRVLTALLGLVALAPAGAAGPDRPAPVRLAIRAEKVLTITKGVVDHGVVLVEDGLIAAVGPAAEVEIPEGTPVIDAEGLWLTPGLIDLHNHSASFNMGDINDMVYQVNPELRVLDVVAAESEAMDRALGGGVTTVLLIPGSGTNMGGFGVLLRTAAPSLEGRIRRWPGVLKIAQAGNPERFAGDLGTGRMGMNWLVRDVLRQARDYDRAWTAFEREGGEAPARDLRLENMRGVLRGDVPVIVHTQWVPVIAATVRILRDEFGLSPILSHATFDSFKAAPLIVARGLPVNAGPRGLWFDSDRGRIVGVAAEWWRRGVRRLSICTDAPVVAAEELIVQAAVGVKLGLPEEAALRGITIEPAMAIGIADRLGSIEVGKEADLVLFSGPPIDLRSRVEKVLIGGRIVYDAVRDGRRF